MILTLRYFFLDDLLSLRLNVADFIGNVLQNCIGTGRFKSSWFCENLVGSEFNLIFVHVMLRRNGWLFLRKILMSFLHDHLRGLLKMSRGG